MAERYYETGDLPDDGDAPGQGRLVVSWALIVVMLGYGVYETPRRR